jgi:hypothetical protein
MTKEKTIQLNIGAFSFTTSSPPRLAAHAHTAASDVVAYKRPASLDSVRQDDRPILRGFAQGYLLHVGRGNESYKIPATQFALLAYKTLKEAKRPLTEFAGRWRQLIAFMRSQLGIAELERWLRSIDKGGATINASGKRTEIARHCRLTPSALSRSGTPEEYRKASQDLLTWLMLVHALLKSQIRDETDALLGHTADGKNANPFLAIAIASTLGIPVRPLTLRELSSFAARLRDYEAWKRDLPGILATFVGDTKLADDIAAHDYMRFTLATLSYAHNRSVLTLGRTIVLHKGDYARFKALRSDFRKAVRISAQDTALEKKYAHDIAVFNARMDKLHPTLLVRAVQMEPRLASWLDAKNADRLIMASELFSEGRLAAIDLLDAQRTAHVRNLLSKRFSLKSYLHMHLADGPSDEIAQTLQNILFAKPLRTWGKPPSQKDSQFGKSMARLFTSMTHTAPTLEMANLMGSWKASGFSYDAMRLSTAQRIALSFAAEHSGSAARYFTAREENDLDTPENRAYFRKELEIAERDIEQKANEKESSAS